MGVSELNKLITKITNGVSIPLKDIDAKTLIIDGSNMLVSVLSTSIKTLKTIKPLTDWDGVNADLLYQTKYMIEKTTQTIMSTLNTFIRTFHLEEVYFVVDPPSTVTYSIDGQTMDTVCDEYYEMLRPVDGKLDIDAKADEQEKRKNAQLSKIKKIDIMKVLGEPIDEIITAYNHSTWFNDFGNMIGLSELVLTSLYKRFGSEACNIYVVRSHDEADLVIKCIAEQQLLINNENDILVASRDTDYCVLFCDTQQVILTDLSVYGSRYIRPYDVFRTLLTNSDIQYDSSIFDIIIRFAPIFGNDYTIKNKIINASSETIYDELKDILYKPTSVKYSKSKKVYKFCSRMKHLYMPNNEMSIHNLDERILNHDRDYFMRYFKSVLIYTNWMYFNKYSIMNTTQDEERLLINYYNKYIDYKSICVFTYNRDAKSLLESIKLVIHEGENIMDVYNTIDTTLCVHGSIINTDDQLGDEYNLE